MREYSLFQQNWCSAAVGQCVLLCNASKCIQVAWNGLVILINLKPTFVVA